MTDLKSTLLLFLLLNVGVTMLNAYKTYYTESPDLCSQIKKRKIKFPKSSGVIVEQRRLHDHLLPWTSNLLCKFQLDATSDRNGILAVVQSLSLRQNKTTGECVDYVQFKIHDSSSKSIQFCGRITTRDDVPNWYIDPKGQLDVEIFVDKEPLAPNERFDLKLVFTTFRNCIQTNDNYRPCNEETNVLCIRKEFFKDGYVNCPFPNCVDEDGCDVADDDEDLHMRKTYYEYGVGNRAIVASVSTLLILFGIFVAFVWMCKHYKRFCWSEEFANDQRTTAASQNVEMRVAPEAQRPYAPTAPPCAVNLDDKDLPPTYESLFTNR